MSEMQSPDGMKAVKLNVRTHAITPWIYEVASGSLFHYSTGEWLAQGYSGRPASMNKPADEHLKGVGPIPRGLYQIGRPRHSEKTGRFVLDLTPVGHAAMGRTGLQIHGDNTAMNGSASSGCIILPPKIRSQIAAGSPFIVCI